MKTKQTLLALLTILSLGWIWASSTDAPKAPFDLTVKSRFEGGTAVAVLKWQDASDNELGFEVMRSDDNGKNFKVVGLVGANSVRHEDKVGKYVSGAFQYRVRAFNQSGKSEPSNVAGVWF